MGLELIEQTKNEISLFQVAFTLVRRAPEFWMMVRAISVNLISLSPQNKHGVSEQLFLTSLLFLLSGKAIFSWDGPMTSLAAERTFLKRTEARLK